MFAFQLFVKHNFDMLYFQVPCLPVAHAVANVLRYL